jgi:hypothetical protein
MEENIPVVLIGDAQTKLSGEKCVLLNESTNKRDFIAIPIIQKLSENESGELCAVAAWDSTQHDSIYLNQQTLNDQYIYLILKIKLKLKEPFDCEVVVRKRICVQIYLNQQLTYLTNRFSKFMNNETTKRLLNVSTTNRNSTVNSTGLTVCVISNIPNCLQECESRDTLAIIAASSSNHLRHYEKAIENVVETLTFDCKRQAFLLKKYIQKHSDNFEKQSTKSASSHDSFARKSSGSEPPSQLLHKTLTVMAGSIKNLNASLTNMYLSKKLEVVELSDSKSEVKTTNGNHMVENPNQTEVLKMEDAKFSAQVEEKPDECEKTVSDKEEKETVVEKIEATENEKPREKQDLIDNVRPDPIHPGGQASLIVKKFEMSHSPSNTSISSNLSELDLTKLPDWVKMDSHVVVSTNHVLNKPGQIKFIGDVKFAKGLWIGVELERSTGMNDGSVKGIKYFECEPNKGVFVKLDKLTPNKLYQQNNTPA